MSGDCVSYLILHARIYYLRISFIPEKCLLFYAVSDKEKIILIFIKIASAARFGLTNRNYRTDLIIRQTGEVKCDIRKEKIYIELDYLSESFIPNRCLKYASEKITFCNQTEKNDYIV